MKRTLCAVALVAAVIATLVPAVPAGAGAAPLVVKAGSGFGNVPYFTNRVFAPQEGGVATVHIHSGDVLNLQGSPFLLPVGQEPAQWKADNATDPDDAFAVVNPDPDGDLPGVDAPSKFNAALFIPTNPECGDSAVNPCDFDGSNSDPVAGVYVPGDVPRVFVRITAQPNETIWAIAPFGTASETDLRIIVEPEGQEATTQAELDEAKQVQKAQDKQTANEVIDELNQLQRHRENGHWVYDVQAGWEEGPIEFFMFFPQRTLNVPKGSVIRYHFETNTIEPHTATLPFKAGKKTVRTSFVPSCDPDGDEGEGPDVQPDFQNQDHPCDEDPQLEFDLTRRLTSELGDGKFPGGPKSYENSGMFGGGVPTGIPGVVGGHGTWDLKFTKRSGDKSYKFLCAIHGAFMSGSVKVHR